MYTKEKVMEYQFSGRLLLVILTFFYINLRHHDLFDDMIELDAQQQLQISAIETELKHHSATDGAIIDWGEIVTKKIKDLYHNSELLNRNDSTLLEKINKK